MKPIAAADLDRAEKMALDTGEAASVEEAKRIFAGYRLQIAVGGGVAQDPPWQAALLTAVNAAHRAFKGGVDVRLDSPEAACLTPWGRGQSLAGAVFHQGGRPVSELLEGIPTLVIGNSDRLPETEVLLHLRSSGWVGYVAPKPHAPTDIATPTTLSAILSAGLGVSECFQHVRGDPVPGFRDVGLSLWRPDLDWRDPDAVGPAIRLLPAEWWLIGLGHLGQAYAWTIGALPYPEPNRVTLMLQDVDFLEPANKATGLLATDQNLGHRKTRCVAAAMEALGFTTAISERLLNAKQRVGAGEPRVALAGLDGPDARRRLEDPGYRLVVDAGLGGGVRDYNEIVIHSFPAVRPARKVFPAAARSEAAERGERVLDSAPAYQDQDRAGADRCGLLEAAGRAVSTAFVGVCVATLVISEALRPGLGGISCEVLDLSLRNPHHRECVLIEGEREVRWRLASTSDP